MSDWSVGTFVAHAKKSEWGHGVILESSARALEVLFEVRGPARIARKLADKMLVEVAKDEVGAGSPILEKRRYDELLKPAAATKARKAKSAKKSTGPRSTSKLAPKKSTKVGTRCTHCRNALKKTQRTENKIWQSCPRCSQRSGSEHVFYKFDDAYGRPAVEVKGVVYEDWILLCRACRYNEEPDFPSRQCNQVMHLS